MPVGAEVPEAVRALLGDFCSEMGLRLRLHVREPEGEGPLLFEWPADPSGGSQDGITLVREVSPREGPDLRLEVSGPEDVLTEHLANLIQSAVERVHDLAQEIRFFTYEVSERYEEINLLYSISETLGSILGLDESSKVILGELCEVLGARRGSLWVYDAQAKQLDLRASVGDKGLSDPLPVEDPGSVTAQVFREGRSVITSLATAKADFQGMMGTRDDESFLSVPIRYSPPAGEARTVGVINLIGPRRGGRFTASDQKLLSAIASQVGAALENHRLIEQILMRERMAKEMELAHHLQMKLLPTADKFDRASVAARVEPADQVGGDFFQLIKLPGDRVGIMIGDVSSHGFPAALIMALSMSAATIYAAEFDAPAMVLRHLDASLREELESTEMYLTLFYGVLDAAGEKLVYSNAGHPHAFLVHCDGSRQRLAATDPPVGIAGEGAYGQQEVNWGKGIDLLLLFTDGLSDTLTSPETGKGEQAVLDIVAEHRGRSPCEIVEALFERAHSVTASVPSDDRTALVLRA